MHLPFVELAEKHPEHPFVPPSWVTPCTAPALT
jgi:hypothetical protein